MGGAEQVSTSHLLCMRPGLRLSFLPRHNPSDPLTPLPGNITKSPALPPTDLSTPHIKSSNYTTGRGGTGNIVTNDDPLNARRAQDVDVADHSLREPEQSLHVGRGGAGNVADLPKDEADENRKRNTARRESFRQEREKLVGKGKELLGKVTGKK